MLVRPILSTILLATRQDENSSFYSYQMIIYKMCLFFTILVGFMMKKIEILINFDQLSKEEFKRQLDSFVCRSRTYLTLFLLDIIFSITLAFWLLHIDRRQGGELNQVIRVLLIMYAVFWCICFFYLLYISIMFMAMAERFMKDILQYTGWDLYRKRSINIFILIIFNIGQCKFFLINGIVLITLVI